KGIPSVIVFAVALFLFWFWIRMLIDCLTREFAKKIAKVLWFMVVGLLQVPGAFIYWLVIYHKH
ncbi:hypothetical protein ACFL2I_04415, partial [Candidatus Omnitrophota bacterium]